MRRTLWATAMAFGLGVSGQALGAHPPDVDGLPGNQGCISTIGPNGDVLGPRFKNPGKYFQAVREANGRNPKEQADVAGSLIPDLDANVGALIDWLCDDPDV